jgi:L-alanine-DL-glutamate epimerase-like enolase superfamily enzyme
MTAREATPQSAGSSSVPIRTLQVSAYTIPTDSPESDGTIEWDSTTIVVVQIEAGDRRGLGYSYADSSTAELIQKKLRDLVIGQDAFRHPQIWEAMVRSIRNLGRPGIASMAISAVDNALWDLHARLLDVPLVRLLGQRRAGAPIYGSGGFTSYSIERLQSQLGNWVSNGIPRVKMKIGRNACQDRERVRMARNAIGARAELFVDANGAYRRKEALAQAESFCEYGVTWFEEPVSSDDLEGLRMVRHGVPDPIDVAAGEYGYDLTYFQRMLAACAVDVLQADATRCGGITGFLQAATLAEAWGAGFSAHCAPALHMHICCAVPRLRHIEYFHDHVRIEHMLFDGVQPPVHGELRPDLSHPGMGLELKQADAQQWAA